MVHAEHSADHHGHHVTPFKTLMTVFAALIGLTIFTVLTAQMNLGPLNVPLALAIAIAKATLVVMFFMALKYDRPVNSLVFVIGIVFVMIFLVFTWFDTGFRGDLGNVDSRTIQDRMYEEEQLRARDPGIRGAVAAPIDTAGTEAASTTPQDADGPENAGTQAASDSPVDEGASDPEAD